MLHETLEELEERGTPRLISLCHQGVWEPARGSCVKITAMEDKHLTHTIKMLKNYRRSPRSRVYLKSMLKEFARRRALQSIAQLI